MRDAINPSEEASLVNRLRAGQPWDEVRESLPGVDPLALDRGFKDRCHRLAGLQVEKPVPVPAQLPEVESPSFKKGKK